MKNGFAWNTHPANRKKIFYPKISYTHPLKKNKFTHEKLFHARLKEKLFFLRFTSFFKKN